MFEIDYVGFWGKDTARFKLNEEGGMMFSLSKNGDWEFHQALEGGEIKPINNKAKIMVSLERLPVAATRWFGEYSSRYNDFK